jgi:hypothetical protein
MHKEDNKEEIISQEKLNTIYYGIIKYWKNKELNNPDSIFYYPKSIEKEFKKVCPKSGGTTLKILKSIKLSVMEKGKCYYTERDFAKQFKVNKKTVHQSLTLIEEKLQTKFINIPMSIINNYKKKTTSPFRQILIPPGLYKLVVDDQNKLVVDGNKLVVDEGKLVVERGVVGGRMVKKPNDFNIKKTVPNIYTLYTTLYNTLICNIYFSSFGKRKNVTNDFASKSCATTLFIERKPMKYKLKVKPRLIVSYKSFGLKPYQFVDHVEVHRELYKWIEILIENNVVPKVEQTKMFLNYWNNLGNKRFKRHRINLKSITFKMICLALTYRMWSENINFETIEKAIDNFNTLSNSQGKLLHTKKLDCLIHFLWNSKTYGQKDYFKLCILDEQIVLTEYYCKELPPKKSFEIVRKLFGFIFYKDRQEEGKLVFKRNYKKFIDFTNKMIENHRTKEMGRFDEYDDPIDGFSDYINTYFSYCFQSIKNSNSTFVWTPSFILDLHSQFVLWLSHQAGWKDFMKDKKVSDINEKPKKYRLEIKNT